MGSGRHFEEDGFLEKLDNVDGYILNDIESFPAIPYWIVSVDVVKSWRENGELGSSPKITCTKALNLLKALDQGKL